MSVVVCYFIISVFAKSVLNFNIFIPCLWNTLFHFKCPGCGLTTATVMLIEFKWSAAYHANPLIFLLVPIGLLLILSDYYKFINKNNLNDNFPEG
jgi:hypothetical protein